jgi:hypothetical protein
LLSSSFENNEGELFEFSSKMSYKR